MKRAVLYARFSSDLQRSESIEDQFAVCRALAEREGLDVTGTYQDAAISGASTANRSGFQALMRDAAARRFDILVCEALDRLSRSQADVAAAFEDLRFHGVSVRTLSEGVVDEMHVGLKGTMNALQLQEIARKTRRGLQGVNRQGRHTGGRVYGYAVRREFDDAGEPVRGLRQIVPEEAAVVIEIFKRYAAGASARAIAQWLNGRGLPSPRGGKWNASTINGNAERANGVIHNELYRGVLVFGRQTWVKDRLTAKRRARTGRPEDLQRTLVPDLRIVPEDLWLRVRERYEENRLGPLRPRPVDSLRPRHLLSGKLSCGCCGGPMIRSGSEQRFVCSWRRERGSAICSSGRSAKGGEIETRVLAALRDRLLEPKVVAVALEEARQELNERNKAAALRRSSLIAELEGVKRRADRLLDQVADGVLSGSSVREKLAAFEARRTTIEADLSTTDSHSLVSFHPGISGQYRRMVDSLAQSLHRKDSDAAAEARDLVRKLIDTVVVTPLPERGQFSLTVKGKIAALVNQDGDLTTLVGAGAGFEPATFRL